MSEYCKKQTIDLISMKQVIYKLKSANDQWYQ